LRFVCRAVWRRSGAGFGWVTDAGASATYGVICCELAAFATIFVGVVAYGVVLELACCRVTALVISTPGCAAAIAVFALFNDAVATLLTGDCSDAFVVCQACCLDAVTANGRANVADGARRELRNALTGGRVHNILLAGITSRGAERTALLRTDGCFVCTSLRGAVVDGSKSMASFMTAERKQS
jgi:hypothetical protein